MRLVLSVLLCLVAMPCMADEEEAIAALKTAGVSCSKNKKTGKYSVRLERNDISIEKLKRLSEIPVHHLELQINKRKDAEAIGVINKLPGVTSLIVGGTHMTDADMKGISEIGTLTVIGIYSSGITDKGLLELAKIKGLKEVTASSDRITQRGKEKLNEMLPKCVVH